MMMDIRLQYHPEDSTIFFLCLFTKTHNKKYKGKKERKREKILE